MYLIYCAADVQKNIDCNQVQLTWFATRKVRNALIILNIYLFFVDKRFFSYYAKTKQTKKIKKKNWRRIFSYCKFFFCLRYLRQLNMFLKTESYHCIFLQDLICWNTLMYHDKSKTILWKALLNLSHGVWNFRHAELKSIYFINTSTIG